MGNGNLKKQPNGKRESWKVTERETGNQKKIWFEILTGRERLTYNLAHAWVIIQATGVSSIRIENIDCDAGLMVSSLTLDWKGLDSILAVAF